MATATRTWTAEMVRALPEDGQRYEVIDGALFVTPAPRLVHQEAVLGMAERVRAYLREHPVAYAVVSPADIELDPRTLVQPDVFVVPLVDGRRPASWKEITHLLLVVEVLSPTTARADRDVKRRLYQRSGVADYWIVDVDARLVERWTPGDERPEIISDRLEWCPDPKDPPLVIDLVRYFADVVGES